MTTQFGLGVFLTVYATMQPMGRSQDRFPRWAVAPVQLVGTWERAESVVVGDVSNIVAVGSQQIDTPPWPVPLTIHEIYLCEADFHADAVVRGRIPTAGRKFIWAAIRPGCGLEYSRYGYEGTVPPTTRVWFLREEDEYIRPAVDAGGIFFAWFHVAFTIPPTSSRR